MLFNGEGEAFNVGAFLETINPYTWASLGISLCIGLSVVGSAWYVCAQSFRLSPLTASKGYLHDRCLDCWWRCQGP